jgi:tRNA/tmRNA/rRNA uracil-C5-methylase (TrmA/RlmC/RlmD family)
MIKQEAASLLVEPPCRYFGECGGCSFQHLSYEAELKHKEDSVRKLFQTGLGIAPDVIEPILPSATPFGYRSRIDLNFRRTRDGRTLLGFMNSRSNRLVEIQECLIARKELNESLAALPQILLDHPLAGGYRRANITLKVGEDHRVLWGGIGRRSLQLSEDQFLWVTVEGKRIHYSLDTFFQANTSALPLFAENLRRLIKPSPETILFDLFCGVGLFGILFAEECKEVIGIEESEPSYRLGLYNQRFHNLTHLRLVLGRVEDQLSKERVPYEGKRVALLLDPPRRGLSQRCQTILAREMKVERIVYVSCSAETLARDLKVFLEQGWTLKKLVTIDFFPQTPQLELIALLTRE